VKAFDDLPEALGLRSDRGHVILKLGDPLAQIGVLARQRFGRLSGVHGFRPLPNRTKIDGRASAPSTLNADATRSGAINDSEEASRRKQSTASVAAHARRRTPYMGACGLNY